MRLNAKFAAMAALAVGVSVTAAEPAQATITTFLSVSGTGTDFVFTENNAKTGGSFTTYQVVNGVQHPGYTPVTLTFSQAELSALDSLSFALNLSGTVTAPSSGASFLQSIGIVHDTALTGSFTIKYEGTTNYFVNSAVTLTPGEVVLSGSFVDGVLSVNSVPGSTADLTASTLTAGTTVTYDNTSPILDFTSVGAKDLDFGLGGITHLVNHHAINGLIFGGTNDVPGTFNATLDSHLAADPLPAIVGAVPEASIWTMLMLGFGMTGLMLRTGRKNAAMRTA